MKYKIYCYLVCWTLCANLAGLCQYHVDTDADSETVDMTNFTRMAELLINFHISDFALKSGLDSVALYYQLHPQRRGEFQDIFPFGFAEQRGYYVVFGKFIGDGFYELFQFRTAGDEEETPDRLDSAIVHPVARAIRNAQTQAMEFAGDPDFTFRTRVIRYADHSIGVWLFPHIKRDSSAVLGIYAAYRFDATGNHTITANEYIEDELKKIKMEQPGNIRLKYPDEIQPPLDAMHFCWFYAPLNLSMSIETKRYEIEIVRGSRPGWRIRDMVSGKVRFYGVE